MGRCQGRYCAPVVARMTTAEVGEFGLFAPRPPAKPVPIRALTVEQPEWTGHTISCRPTWRGRARPSRCRSRPSTRW